MSDHRDGNVFIPGKTYEDINFKYALTGNFKESILKNENEAVKRTINDYFSKLDSSGFSYLQQQYEHLISIYQELIASSTSTFTRVKKKQKTEKNIELVNTMMEIGTKLRCITSNTPMEDMTRDDEAILNSLHDELNRFRKLSLSHWCNASHTDNTLYPSYSNKNPPDGIIYLCPTNFDDSHEFVDEAYDIQALTGASIFKGTWQSLIDYIRSNTSIKWLHCIGHGGETLCKTLMSFVSADQNRNFHVISDKYIIDSLRNLKDQLVLVTFNACSSYPLVEGITKHGGIRCSCGWSTKCSDAAARIVFTKFYYYLYENDDRMDFKKAYDYAMSFAILIPPLKRKCMMERWSR